ncbi:MAG: hypothetical protein ACREXS_06530 [Gammaproteobacteria bacterium]
MRRRAPRQSRCGLSLPAWLLRGGGFFVGRFVAGVFFGLLAFRVTLGGAFAVFTAGFIAFAISVVSGFGLSKSVQLLSPLILLSTYLHVAG